jgi:hypothetical protein
VGVSLDFYRAQREDFRLFVERHQVCGGVKSGGSYTFTRAKSPPSSTLSSVAAIFFLFGFAGVVRGQCIGETAPPIRRLDGKDAADLSIRELSERLAQMCVELLDAEARRGAWDHHFTRVVHFRSANRSSAMRSVGNTLQRHAKL